MGEPPEATAALASDAGDGHDDGVAEQRRRIISRMILIDVVVLVAIVGLVAAAPAAQRWPIALGGLVALVVSAVLLPVAITLVRPKGD